MMHISYFYEILIFIMSIHSYARIVSKEQWIFINMAMSYHA